jgi:predicted transcriptional regulator
MKIEATGKNLSFFECFSSATRLKIIELLNEKPMNIKDLAEAVGYSSAIMTKHIQKLEESGIISTHSEPGKRGTQKMCSLTMDSVLLQLKTEATQPDPNRYSLSIPIGQYANYQVKPTCGLASETKIIGFFDDARYFSDPEHVRASHLWFSSGYIEYRLPNYLLSHQKLRSVDISLELCSEAPGFQENWPSDISFYLNNIPIGTWTCPGDFGSKRGAYTPIWWEHGTQHGLLKNISLRKDGTYLDGIRLSDTTIHDIPLAYGNDFHFRIASHIEAEHCGGVSLFGRKFGNYDQDIEVTIAY